MVSARVRVHVQAGLYEETGQRATVVDRDGAINVYVDRAALAGDAEGVLGVVCRHMVELLAPRAEETERAVG